MSADCEAAAAVNTFDLDEAAAAKTAEDGSGAVSERALY